EVPEDIAAEGCGDAPMVAPHEVALPVASAKTLDRAAEIILRARRPLVMIGAAADRARLVPSLSAFIRRTQLPFFNTQMGKGAVDGASELYRATAALSENDYGHDAIDEAALIVSIGHDTVEKPPFLMSEK